MTQQTQQHNWNEHRYDEPFMSGMLHTAFIVDLYFIGAVAYFAEFGYNYLGLAVILISYEFVTLVFFPLRYRSQHGWGLGRYVGGAITVNILIILIAVGGFVLFASFVASLY